MDPVSVVGLVESSLGLALQFGNAAKALSDIAGKYKNAKLATKFLAQNLDILQLTWSQIGQWFEAHVDGGSLRDNDLVKRVRSFLETGTLVMEALEQDLLEYDVDNLNFAQRSKLIWNENTLQGHQIRIRDQTLSMSLFLQAVKLPTPKARAKLLQKSEDQFRRSDESAYSRDSIVPSRLSLSTGERHSMATSSQGSLEYRPLSFENRLFMSKVYLRNSKSMMIKKIFRVGTHSKGRTRDMVQRVPSWEAIPNVSEADSLPLSIEEVPIEDDEIIRPHSRDKGGVHNSQTLHINMIPAHRSTAVLIQACEQGNSAQVRWLLDNGLDVHARFNEVMYSGFTAIHVAALYGHINVMEALLNCAANIEEEDVMGKRRPLHFAAGSRRGSMVRFLIRHGAQVDAEARNAVQPIHEASWSGSIEVLDALIEAGAAVDCSDRLGYQPLHWATMTPNQPDIIRCLLRNKADVEAKTLEGFRAVHLTCRTDPTNLCTVLACGAKTDYNDGTDSALITAISSESKFGVEILLKHGVDPNRKGRDGSTALYALATLRSNFLGELLNDREICRLLLDHGADVYVRDRYGEQVLHSLATQFHISGRLGRYGRIG